MIADARSRALAMPVAAAGTARKLASAGASDVGRQRTVNEDRFHIDPSRGVFMVVDGVGGQAAGGKAADVAISMLRERLERQTGPPADRVREAITIANNEIHRLASQRPEWRGMACVLTVVVVDGGVAVVGHVGDTRLYRLRGNTLEKITPDHSPVGEREDARELSEFEAMRHPRRNEVYRDVGSEHHEVADADFVHVMEVDFPSDAAILLCSDGLTDLVPAEAIRQVAVSRAGDPGGVVAALVDAANEAGGKDNVTVVYVEGEAVSEKAPRALASPSVKTASRVLSRVIDATVLAAVLGILLWQVGGWPAAVAGLLRSSSRGAIAVQSNESIMAAIDRAPPGSTVLVEPGEYRERLILKQDVRVVSRVPRGATLRLPGTATEQDPAVSAIGISGAELVGFKIVGDAATPLGIGVIVRDASVRLVDLEVTGASASAVDLGAGDAVELIGSDIKDNPGEAVVVRTAATARITHNVFMRNGSSERTITPMRVERDARPHWSGNVFENIEPSAMGPLDEPARLALPKDNWFLGLKPANPGAPNGREGRDGRGGRGR